MQGAYVTERSRNKGMGGWVGERGGGGAKASEPKTSTEKDHRKGMEGVGGRRVVGGGWWGGVRGEGGGG